MSTIQAIYQSKEDAANEKEFKYTIKDSVHNNNQIQAATAHQNMESLTDTLILLQESINTYLTSKLYTNEDNNIEDTMGDDDENEGDDIEENTNN